MSRTRDRSGRGAVGRLAGGLLAPAAVLALVTSAAAAPSSAEPPDAGRVATIGPVSADGWGPPVTIVPKLPVTSSAPAESAGFTSKGREVVLLRRDGSLLAVSRPAGQLAWASPVSLTPRSPTLASIRLLTWGDGRATAVWTLGCCSVRIFYKDMAADGTWGPRRHVEIPTRPAIFSLRATRDASGTFALAWVNREGSGAQAAVRFRGQPWRMTAEHPLVDSTPTGVFIDRYEAVHVAVYQETADTKTASTQSRGVFVLDVDRDGSWGTPHRVGPPAGIELQDYGRYAFSANRDGDVLLAWGEYDAAAHVRNVVRVRHVGGGGFGPRHVLPSQPSIGGGGVLAALTPRGGAVIVYGLSPSDTGYQLFLQRMTPHGTWLNPRPLTPDTGYSYAAKLAVDPDGTVLTTYSRSDQSGNPLDTRVIRCVRGRPCGDSATFPGLDSGSLIAFGPTGRGLLVTQRPLPGDPTRSDRISRRLAPLA